ncbi:hydroxymethylbilane synthase [Lactococcus termiticola]|uniref:Porphobilinogen deaminase n=1 Tax=Lactococcus termiticola TaxID=2169526 RepID=A0A2R5HJE4_9LACT|nr:hydroxymethylbilane synthase [Lactococcus termiticola]GBG96688.1 hydroxymethylbilane synthase [Lactococcus termiticola]
MKKIKVGTRKSPLAMKQTELVIKQMIELQPELEVEIVGISTQGDRDQVSHLAEIGGKGIFVKEVEKQLLEGKIDLAVHSLKDMPAILPDELTLAAYPKRANPYDCIVYNQEPDYEGKLRLGTSSIRRGKQLKQLFPNLEIEPVRGKIETRIEKIKTQNLDAVVLACAGLERMGYLEGLTIREFSPEECIPAVAQGILGIECRRDDQELLELLSHLNHAETELAAKTERHFLALMNGNCEIPIGGLALKTAEGWAFSAFLASDLEDEGRTVRLTGPDPLALANEAFERLK